MIWSTNLRFNTEKSPYREAYNYLRGMDRKTHKSINHVVAAAVVEYFKRLERSEDDPYFETREREDSFVSRIVQAVGKAVEKFMTSFMAAYITSKLSDISNPIVSGTVSESPIPKQENSDTSAEDIDFDFVGN
ncbi:MAG: adenylate cyclase [Oscillospiraceae bacterium]|nr:adenylate cyclase [Oscillospiraceae bacterium]